MKMQKRDCKSSSLGVLRLMILLILSCFLSIAYSHDAHAVGISVTRAVLDYSNVLKGGYAEQTFYVSTDAGFNIPLTYQLGGDTANWTTVVPDLNALNLTVYVNNTHYQSITVIVQPPADMPAGNYTGTIRIITGAVNQVSGQYGSQLQAAFLVTLHVSITGQQIVACSAGGIALQDTELGDPLQYYMIISDNGNVRVTPNVTIDIWNQDQTSLVATKSLTFGNQILPTTSQTLSSSFGTSLNIGQYWAYVNVAPCSVSQLVTFNVYNVGTIVDTGEFVRLDSKPWASIGEIVPLSAVFKNTGNRTESIKFKGVVMWENQIVDTINTDYYNVAPGTTQNIDFYYTPKKLGQYVITGSILFNNKKSFEKSTVINVNSGTEQQGFNWFYVIIIIVILLILFALVRRIRATKKRMRRI